MGKMLYFKEGSGKGGNPSRAKYNQRVVKLESCYWHFYFNTFLLKCQARSPNLQELDIMGYVYKITNTVNNKAYIGISVHEPDKR